jgi:GNAT superfamily N-acetyltransferase
MEDLNGVRQIEERTLNAWPALQEILYDGWVLRFADGYTRRSNSVNPIYEGSQGVFEKTLTCEDIYKSRNLSPVFKISPLVYPRDLDEILEARGYEKEATTSVQSLNLELLPESDMPETLISCIPGDGWHGEYAELQGMGDREHHCFRKILAQTAATIFYLSVKANGKMVAGWLAILEGVYVGLFGLITEPEKRGNGFGRRMVVDALGHARKQGAHLAYLHVLMRNDPALRLYAKLGFRESYHYWYRTRASGS